MTGARIIATYPYSPVVRVPLNPTIESDIRASVCLHYTEIGTEKYVILQSRVQPHPVSLHQALPRALLNLHSFVQSFYFALLPWNWC